MDWAFSCRLRLRGEVFGDYVTGLLAEVVEGGSPVRYVFGMEDGISLSIRRIDAAGATNTLRAVAWNASEAEIRIRRTEDMLSFDQRVGDVWTSRHVAVLAARSTAAKVGMMLAADTPQSVKVAFEEAILVDPGSGP